MACKMEFGKKVSHTHRAYPESRQLSRPKKKSGLKQEKKKMEEIMTPGKEIKDEFMEHGIGR
jgi:hypothetical protein